MAKYVVIREVTAELIEDKMNDYFEKGYELSQFVFKSAPLEMYVAVMELKKPQKPQRFYLEPMVG